MSKRAVAWIVAGVVAGVGLVMFALWLPTYANEYGHRFHDDQYMTRAAACFVVAAVIFIAGLFAKD